MKALLLNDVHIGAVRSAGTTVATRAAIQAYLLWSFQNILSDYPDRRLIINGDLFDGYEVDSGQLLALYLILHGHLTANPEVILDLVRGNHDIAKNSLRTSSFAMLCKLLETAFPDRVRVYEDQFAMIDPGVWVIPHCLNQDSFDVELEKAVIHVNDEGKAPGHLLLHANYHNKFAVEADHSLNVSEDQARELVKAGWTLVFAHEHQARKAMAGQVIILGNQWPSSVSDCLAHGDGQKDGKKFAHLLDTEEDFIHDCVQVTMTPIQTWQAEGDFVTMKWNEIEPTEARFIRIEGEASADESADVINTIARYRQGSKALVISNAVKVDGIAGIGDMAALSVEKLQSINVLDALCDELTAPEAKVVRDLLGEGNDSEAETAPAAAEAVAEV